MNTVEMFLSRVNEKIAGPVKDITGWSVKTYKSGSTHDPIIVPKFFGITVDQVNLKIFNCGNEELRYWFRSRVVWPAELPQPFLEEKAKKDNGCILKFRFADSGWARSGGAESMSTRVSDMIIALMKWMKDQGVVDFVNGDAQALKKGHAVAGKAKQESETGTRGAAPGTSKVSCAESCTEAQERNYKERLDRIERYALDVYKVFLEKAVWKCLSERRPLQRNFHAYCRNYDSFCEQAAAEGGVFDAYCWRHRADPILSDEIENLVDGYVAKGAWLGGLVPLELDWLGKKAFENVLEPKPLDAYKDLMAELSELADETLPSVVEEAYSLAYFEGNRDEIVLRVEAWKEVLKLKRSRRSSFRLPPTSLL